MEDFNEAGEQSDVIPAGTVATVQLTVRPGGAGEDGWLKRAKDGNSEALDCEFVLLDGQYAKRKFWDLFTLSGTTENHADYGQKSRATIRAMLELVHGINPKDKSEEAKKARAVENFGGSMACGSWLASVLCRQRTATKPRTGSTKSSRPSARTGAKSNNCHQSKGQRLQPLRPQPPPARLRPSPLQQTPSTARNGQRA